MYVSLFFGWFGMQTIVLMVPLLGSLCHEHIVAPTPVQKNLSWIMASSTRWWQSLFNLAVFMVSPLVASVGLTLTIPIGTLQQRVSGFGFRFARSILCEKIWYVKNILRYVRSIF